MIISRKKFEREVRKACEEMENKIMERESINDRFRYVYDDIESLRKRVSALEEATGLCNVPFPVNDASCRPIR